MKYQDFKGALLQAFNTTNKLNPPLRLEDVIYGGTGVWLQGLCNTRVTISARIGNGLLIGARTLFYNRRRADQVLLGMTVPGKPGDYPNTNAAVAALAEKYSASIYVEDFFNRTLTPDMTTVLLTPRGDALVWLPVFGLELPYDGT